MTVASPGLSYAAERLGRLALPKLTITSPAPGIHFDRDVAVSVRDGTKLRLNVFRPDQQGRFPVTMCAHPYGKDVLPRPCMFRRWPADTTAAAPLELAPATT